MIRAVVGARELWWMIRAVGFAPSDDSRRRRQWWMIRAVDGTSFPLMRIAPTSTISQTCSRI
jgi:hypothetical protein